jgi:hypothetical protein
MLSQRLFSLTPGQRSPAFLIETEKAVLVSWYLRLADPGLGTPTAGIVRVAATRTWLELSFPDPVARFAEISAVSAWLCQLRCRDASYARSAVSLEPIVRLEISSRPCCRPSPTSLPACTGRSPRERHKVGAQWVSICRFPWTDSLYGRVAELPVRATAV